MELIVLAMVYAIVSTVSEWLILRIRGVERVEVPRGWGDWVKGMVSLELQERSPDEP